MRLVPDRSSLRIPDSPKKGWADCLIVLIASIFATVTDDLSLHYLSDFTFSDDAYFQRIGTSLRVRPGVVLTLDFEFFKGSPETYFRRWCNNDRIVTSIKWSL